MWERPSFETLKASLADPCNPIGMRMRAAYYLRQLHTETTAPFVNSTTTTTEQPLCPDDIVAVLALGLLEPLHGSLLRHEFAYIMGQLRDERCCPTLEQVLQADDDCTMVRHECAEALGAIGAHRSQVVLQGVLSRHPDTLELTETCRLALDVMKWRQADESGNGDEATMPAVCACMLNPYSTMDPAPPHPTHANMSLEAIGDILCNPDLELFARYRAMFSLRNRGGETAVLQLCRALVEDTTSALLRHEVAYVLGQMQHPASVEALEQSLRRTDEHSMVRHESAEALGAIDGRWDDVERILTEFVSDEDDVIRESCLVALDAADYWGRAIGTAEDEPVDDTDDVPAAEVPFAKQKADQRILVNHFNTKD